MTKLTTKPLTKSIIILVVFHIRTIPNNNDGDDDDRDDDDDDDGDDDDRVAWERDDDPPTRSRGRASSLSFFDFGIECERRKGRRL